MGEGGLTSSKPSPLPNTGISIFSFQTIFQFHPEFQDDSAFLNLPIVCEFTIPSKRNKENPPQLLER